MRAKFLVDHWFRTFFSVVRLFYKIDFIANERIVGESNAESNYILINETTLSGKENVRLCCTLNWQTTFLLFLCCNHLKCFTLSS